MPFGNSLLYGKAGSTRSPISARLTQPRAPVRLPVRREDGWTAGAGWEYRIGRSLVFGIENDYVDLSSARFSGATGGVVPGLPFHVDLDSVRAQTVVARLSIPLDRGPTASSTK